VAGGTTFHIVIVERAALLDGKLSEVADPGVSFAQRWPGNLLYSVQKGRPQIQKGPAGMERGLLVSKIDTLWTVLGVVALTLMSQLPT
jgi:hypothetical protein